MAGQFLVRLWDRDFNCLYSGVSSGADLAECLGDLTVTSDRVGEDGNPEGWRTRTAGKITQVVPLREYARHMTWPTKPAGD